MEVTTTWYLVLGAMLEEGYITRAEFNEARRTTWTDMEPKRITSLLREPHFAFRVRTEAERILAALGVEDPKAAVRTGGYRIITTLDYELQQVGQGRLRRDDTVQRWAPGLVPNGEAITLRMLLSHTAGFTHEAPLGNNYDPVPGTFDAHVRSISATCGAAHARVTPCVRLDRSARHGC